MSDRVGALFRLLSALSVPLLASCTLPATWEEVPGTYVMNHGDAADTLIIRRNRSYERVNVRRGTPPVVDRGGWTVDTLADSTVGVTLEKFHTRWFNEMLPYATDEQGGFWHVHPERTWFGTMTLLVNYDIDWKYVKISPHN